MYWRNSTKPALRRR